MKKTLTTILLLALGVPLWAATISQNLESGATNGSKINYANYLVKTAKHLEELHAEDLARTQSACEKPTNKEFAIIQVFRNAPDSSLTQWIISPDTEIDIPGNQIFLDSVQWIAFSELIVPPFPDLELSAPTRGYGGNPIEFIRVIIKRSESSSSHYYVHPLASIQEDKNGKREEFNSNESWQNAFRFVCAIENLRLVSTSGSEIFERIFSSPNLANSYLTGDIGKLFFAAQTASPEDIKRAINMFLKIDDASTQANQ